MKNLSSLTIKDKMSTEEFNQIRSYLNVTKYTEKYLTIVEYFEILDDVGADTSDQTLMINKEGTKKDIYVYLADENNILDFCLGEFVNK